MTKFIIIYHVYKVVVSFKKKGGNREEESW